MVPPVRVLQVKKFDFEAGFSGAYWKKCVLVKYQIKKANRYPFEGLVRCFQWYIRFIKLSYSLVTVSERKTKGFVLIRHFPFRFNCLPVELW